MKLVADEIGTVESFMKRFKVRINPDTAWVNMLIPGSTS